ncbi:hypothetical protein [Paenibacillus sp. SN-8-1]|uniref:hypothetical protein n=1 Tax=Paenibacillus sp. SN-8-1 TaxID=3435409 RepID=UPI003D9A933A
MSTNPNVSIKYQVKKVYCSCCNQKLPEPKTRDSEFKISKETALSWTDWDGMETEYIEDMIPEFVHETISFFATDSFERITVDKGEFERVKEFILNEVVTPS